jgi:uncharacterized membrane protein YkoI
MKRIFYIVFILFLMVPVDCSMAENISQERSGTIKIYKFDESTYPDMTKITFDHAISIALKECPGKLLEAELDVEEGYLVYEIEVVTAEKNIMEILVDPGNGSILKVSPDEDKHIEKYEDDYTEKPIKSGSIKLESYNEATYPDMAKLSFKDALDIALNKSREKLIGIELEDHDEYLVYQIKTITSEKKIKEIFVDPITGEILGTAIEKSEDDVNEHTVF